MNNFHSLNRKSATRLQRGIAVVEFVIVVPVVLFTMLAVVELGNAILQYNALTHAVRNAARYVADDAGAGTGVVALSAAKITTARNLAAFGSANAGNAILPGLSPANVTVALVDTTNVSVSVAYDYQPVFAPFIPGLAGVNGTGGAFTMRSEVIMRVL